jgi:hypothetical protein
MVAVLWAEHGLPPSETLACPEHVLARAIRYLHDKREAQRKAEAQQKDQGDFARMHQVLSGG